MQPLIVKHFSFIAVPFQIFGLYYFPVNRLAIETSKSWPSYGYKVQFLLFLILLPGLVLAILSSTPIQRQHEDVTKTTIFGLAIKRITYIAFILMVFVGVLSSFLNSKGHRKMMKKIFLIDQISRLHFNKFINSRRILITFYTRFSMFLISIFLYLYLRLQSIERKIRFYQLTINIIPHLIWFLIGCKFLIFIECLKENLKLLESIIKDTLRLNLFIEEKREKSVFKVDAYDILISKLLIIKKILLWIKNSADSINEITKYEVLFLFIMNSTVITTSVYNTSLIILGKMHGSLISEYAINDECRINEIIIFSMHATSILQMNCTLLSLVLL